LTPGVFWNLVRLSSEAKTMFWLQLEAFLLERLRNNEMESIISCAHCVLGFCLARAALMRRGVRLSGGSVGGAHVRRARGSRSTNRGGLTRLLVSGRGVHRRLKGGRWQRPAHSPLTALLAMSSSLIHICCALLLAAQALASLDSSSSILQRALHKKCLHAYTPACFKMEVVALVDKLSAHDSYQVSHISHPSKPPATFSPSKFSKSHFIKLTGFWK
jgi:hypothetical protein